MSSVSGLRASPASLDAWMQLRALDGVGDRIVLALVREWGNPETVLRATADDLIQRGCSAALAEAIVRGPGLDARRRIAREIQTIERRCIDVRSVVDAAYPRRLLTIPDPPPLLFISGTLSPADDLAIALVGARHATQRKAKP